MEIPRIRLDKHGWTMGACVVTLATGAWLMLAPFALGYQPYGASWDTQTRNQFWLGLGVLVLSAVGLALFAIDLVRELRAAGVLAASQTRSQGPPVAAGRPPALSPPPPPVARPPSSQASVRPPPAPRAEVPPPPRGVLQLEGHYPPRTAVIAALDALARPARQTHGESPFEVQSDIRPPTPSQPAGVPPTDGNATDFERAVLLLAQALAEDLAERKHARPADEK
jgi:hypothetical protein